MSFPNVALGHVVTSWIAKRAISKSIAHLDNHMLRDVGLYDQGYRASHGRETRVFDRFR